MNEEMNYPVLFKDAGLEKITKRKLGITTGKVSRTDILNITQLAGCNKNITDLTGLEYATNLVWLDLSGNKICDLTPIAHLSSLKNLLLSRNLIRNISCLDGLTNLQLLHIKYNQVQDCTVLDKLPNLHNIRLRGNPICKFNSLTESNKININDFLRYHGIKSHMSKVGYTALLDYLNSPTKETALSALSKSPEVLKFIHVHFTPLEIEQALQQVVSSPSVTRHFVEVFIKTSTLNGKELEFIQTFGSTNAKRLGMEYTLKTS